MLSKCGYQITEQAAASTGAAAAAERKKAQPAANSPGTCMQEPLRPNKHHQRTHLYVVAELAARAGSVMSAATHAVPRRRRKWDARLQLGQLAVERMFKFSLIARVSKSGSRWQETHTAGT